FPLQRLTYPPLIHSNRTTTTSIYTLSLHDALPIYPFRFPCCWNRNRDPRRFPCLRISPNSDRWDRHSYAPGNPTDHWRTLHPIRSEEHTSELQSLRHLVCRLLLEKKKDSCMYRDNV